MITGNQMSAAEAFVLTIHGNLYNAFQICNQLFFCCGLIYLQS